MADSEIKTIGQVLQRMALFSVEQRVCEAHGAFEDQMMPNGKWAGCRACYEADMEAQKAEHRRMMEEYEAKERLARATIPRRFADATLENYSPSCEAARKAHNLALAYANDFERFKESGTCMIFCGGVGTGKTHLAVGIAKAVIDRKKESRFVSVIDAIRAVKQTYSRDSEKSETEVMAEYLSPALLVLDEVGAQFGTDTEKLILFQIINGRYERVLPTIVISNLAKDSLGEFIGERVIDRLRENGGRLIAFDWASYRRKSSKEQA